MRRFQLWLRLGMTRKAWLGGQCWALHPLPLPYLGNNGVRMRRDPQPGRHHSPRQPPELPVCPSATGYCCWGSPLMHPQRG